MRTFSEFGLSQTLQDSLQELQYTTPTAIQQLAIPAILSGNDVVGQAETGSGKTAAYGLPILTTIEAGDSIVQALVLVPTRELALQVQTALKKFGKGQAGLKVGAVYGGHAFSEERASLRHPPQILIATPGRLADHIHRRTLDLRKVRTMVIDEADKLLELGFREELDEIIYQMPDECQMLLFSATLPDSVRELINRSLTDPQFLETEGGANPDHIEQVAMLVESPKKMNALYRLLSQPEHKRGIIFCNTRATTAQVTEQLKGDGFAVVGLHGEMDQIERDKAMVQFRNGSVRWLVATDLAARGIDIAELETVIHMEIPDREPSFLHRSGRTGRAGREGKVYSLVTSREAERLKSWPQVTITDWLKIQDVPEPKAANISQASAETEHITLYLKAGKKEKISAGDIVGTILAQTGLKANQIGQIQIFDHFSYVAVPRQQGSQIVDILNNAKMKGRKIRVSIVE